MPQIGVQIAETFPLVALSQTSVNKNYARRYRDCLVVVELLGKYVAGVAKGLDEKFVQKHLRSAVAIIEMGDLQPDEIIWCIEEMWRTKKSVTA
jgi:hypothetical protein